MNTTLQIPELSLVVLIGSSGAGKSTLSKRLFKETEIISSDQCRAMISDDENDQTVSKEAFELLHYIAAKRMQRGLLTVIDATSVQPAARKPLVELAREYHFLPVALVLDLPEKVCAARNEARPDRNFGVHVIRKQRSSLRRSFRQLNREGFKQVHQLKSEEEVDAITTITREKLYSNKKDISGPFDIIGDIHGCYDELILLLEKLGYQVIPFQEADGTDTVRVIAPDNRKLIFLGDLVDRGPQSPAVLKLVMSAVSDGIAWCVPGNHDIKLQKYLSGKKVQIRHGLQETIDQLAGESDAFKQKVADFIYGRTSHYLFDEGKLVVAHAGVKESMQGRGSGAVRSFCLYGETTGEIDEFGLPVRYDWANEYRGEAMVVYGHTPVPKAEWLNNTIDIDTGCVFGGALTCLRYPEQELVAVPAAKVYCEPAKPLQAAEESTLSAQQSHDSLLDLKDFTGKQFVHTRLRGKITVQEENNVAALEVMSRFAIDPRWLIYLPPTMAPTEVSSDPGFLEHPAEAFRYYKKQGVQQVICEEKHMGSRAVLVVCKDEKVAMRRFGTEDGKAGVCYTRTGRNFFNDLELEMAFMQRVRTTLTKSGLWESLDTDWVCLDAEIMPWSLKAKALIRDQYAAVGSAAAHALEAVAQQLEMATARYGDELKSLTSKTTVRQRAMKDYLTAYGHYCWNVNDLDDITLAPFHIMASEGNVHADKDHVWHMNLLQQLAAADPGLFQATAHQVVNLDQPEEVESATAWWMDLTGKGGEGMVVKPVNFTSHNRQQLLQPAIKCRGAEYLRIIYGPEYQLGQSLKLLKERRSGRKKSLALTEFALGIEGLERFVNQKPLREVHQCAFGVLALESEPVDPRL